MSRFETWWEQEGQESLYALNTLTDADAKVLAQIAWENGAYVEREACAEICDWYSNWNKDYCEMRGFNDRLSDCAATIRARGEK